jgi:hypothetical protein
MDRIRIIGGERLRGTISISGAKNAALPLMIASRGKISLKAKLASEGNSIEISMPNFVNRTAISNAAWSAS